MNLYELTEQYRTLLESLEIDEKTGEVKGAEGLEIAAAEFDDKAEAYALHYKNLMAESEAIKAECDALEKRSKAAKRKAEALKERLDEAMQAVGKTKHATAKVSLSYIRSSSVTVTDMGLLPPECIRTTAKTEPDKDAISKAIKAGQTVEGAYIEEKHNLQIK